MNNSKILIASSVMALAVAIGAFGAHGLKPHLDAYHLDIFKTGNFYHFIHGIALFISLFISNHFKLKGNPLSFTFFLVGITLFSGSLYVLSLQSIIPNIPSWLGIITPIGGLSFIIGWLILGVKFLKKND